MKLKRYFLIFAFFAVTIIALLYGISPQWFARTFLGIPEVDLNVAHILRATMGLYLAFAIFWLYSAFSDRHRSAAVLTCVVFAGGLLAGRLFSYFADGQPKPILIIYIVLELALVPLAYWIFKLPD
jgi:Domain of unknown function (DUF4345)